MVAKMYQIRQVKQGSHPLILLPRQVMEMYHLSPGKSVTLALGQLDVRAKIKLSPDSQSIALTPALYQALKLPYKAKLNIYQDHHGQLRLGPVIGILTTGVHPFTSIPVGRRSNFFRHLLTAQLNKGVLYFVFSPQLINWQNKTVQGLFLLPHDSGWSWRVYTVPIPDVVYDRVPNRQTELSPQVQTCKKRLEQMGIRLFNPGFFDKWSIHQLLEDHPLAQNYIPETYMAPTNKVLQYMLKKYHMIYLKPAKGSLGLGIYKITYKPSEGYYCRYRHGNQNRLKQFKTLDGLLQHLFQNKLSLRRYLVQQGIDLLKYQGRNLDLRMHLHKDSENQWQVVGIGAKVAGLGSVTTHVRTGGSIVSAQQVFLQLFGKKAGAMEEKLKQVSILLAKAIEERIGQPIGELGFDIGIDSNYQIWMFEGNSKPGRSIFKHPTLRKADYQSLSMIIDYSQYLAQHA
ncbi:YheC/YheD family endospore coat-associated protein [Rubeoparvulum massiliense]|uniref:YheC/YheD family endospore coat-associated protein n=1 Tax=Rubeoparvulum massiliense TaxID=1631346 RepID=UPI00065DC714|nr:YheC/YheD family protein [Rubeoparvulum massiliense]